MRKRARNFRCTGCGGWFPQSGIVKRARSRFNNTIIRYCAECHNAWLGQRDLDRELAHRIERG